MTHNLPVRLIPRDVATRWNSTYDLLVFAVKYSAAIDAITGDKSNRTLRHSELELEEWRIVRDLVKVLKVRPTFYCQISSHLVLFSLKIFKDATLFFSREDISSIANVVPTMDAIDRQLTRGSASHIIPSITELGAQPSVDIEVLPDDELHSAVKMALLLAKKKMDQYYANTDASNIYRIAMGAFKVL